MQMLDDRAVFRVGPPAALGPARLVLDARYLGLEGAPAEATAVGEPPSHVESQLAALAERVAAHDHLLADLIQQVTELSRPWWNRWWTRLSGWWRTVATHR
jgi:hypothetical protein